MHVALLCFRECALLPNEISVDQFAFRRLLIPRLCAVFIMYVDLVESE